MIGLLIAVAILIGCILVGLALAYPSWVLLHAVTWDRSCCDRRWRFKP